MPLLKLTPDKKLSPIERFVRDGLNNRIHSSVPQREVNVVLVFGGYKGDSVQGWLTRNPSATIHAYEPVPEYANVLRSRFLEQSVTVHTYGVGKKAGTRHFTLMKDATSGHPAIQGEQSDRNQTVPVRFESVQEATSQWPHTIDVVEINIEGGEYELLSSLHDGGVLSRMKHIFIQFHEVGKHTEELIEKSRRHLHSSHTQVWNYDMVWEYWRQKKTL